MRRITGKFAIVLAAVLGGTVIAGYWATKGDLREELFDSAMTPKFASAPLSAVETRPLGLSAEAPRFPTRIGSKRANAARVCSKSGTFLWLNGGFRGGQRLGHELGTRYTRLGVQFDRAGKPAEMDYDGARAKCFRIQSCRFARRLCGFPLNEGAGPQFALGHGQSRLARERTRPCIHRDFRAGSWRRFSSITFAR